MKPPDIEAVFAQARTIGDPNKCAEFIAHACGDDHEALAAVHSLLACLPRMEGFLATPVSLQLDRDSFPCVGARIGHYKLLERLGEGACGEVFVAEQQEPVRRRVALKIIKPGMDTRAVIARFEAERQALAMMDHPNIARVFEAGSTESGRPYFVMELVRGIRITDYCDDHQLSTKERLDLFTQVCQAVEHAHQRGIIHRDLKPSNILVTLHDGVPVPKVIDFGLAKAMNQQVLTDKTLYTAFHQFVGTPAYMSPEQAEMSGLGVDTRTDVYALGVLLYEMLTGHTPFDAQTLVQAGLEEMRRILREQEPPRPSTRLSSLDLRDLGKAAQCRRTEPPKLITRVRGDLDWIVMKALEKDRRRRYGSVVELAQDLRRHLNHEPVIARPPSATDRMRKYLRRHRLLVATAAGIGLALLLGGATSVWFALCERRQRERAETSERLSRKQAYVSDLQLASHALRENRFERVRELLERHRPSPGSPDLRGWEWGYLWNASQSDEWFALRAHTGKVHAVAFSPDGKYLVTCGSDRTVAVWDLKTLQAIRRLDCASKPGDQRSVTSLGFTPDGRSLFGRSAGWSADRTHGATWGTALLVWATAGWNRSRPIPSLTNLTGFALSPDGQRMAVRDNAGRATLRDLASGEVLAELGRSPERHAALHFAANRPVLAVVETNTVALWDATASPPTFLRRIALQRRETDWYPEVRLSPDGRWLAVSGPTPTIHLTTEQGPVLKLPTGAVDRLCYSPDGRRLATHNADRSIAVWNTASWTLERSFRGSDARQMEFAFSRDGQLLASTGRDGVVRLWRLSSQPRKTEQLIRLPVGRENVSFSSGAAYVQWGPDGCVRIGTGFPAVRYPERRLPIPAASGLNVSPDGRRLCFQDQAGRLIIWDVPQDRQIAIVPQPGVSALPHEAFSPDGGCLLGLEAATGARVVWNADTGSEIRRFPSSPLQPRPAEWWGRDRRTLLLANENGRTLVIADVETGRHQPGLPHDDRVLCATESHDARLVATLDRAGNLRLWNIRSATQKWGLSLAGPGPDPMATPSFSPDDLRLAVVDGEGRVVVRDVRTGEELVAPILSGPAYACRFSGDGKWLAVLMKDGIHALPSSLLFTGPAAAPVP